VRMGTAKGRAARLMASEVGVGAASDTAARMECAHAGAAGT
jgi:hypothetical protein